MSCRIGRTFGFRNADDVVTQMPPQLFGYIHAGRLIHLPAYSDDLADLGESDLGDTESDAGAVDDHSMVEGYYPRIQLAMDLHPQRVDVCTQPDE